MEATDHPTVPLWIFQLCKANRALSYTIFDGMTIHMRQQTQRFFLYQMCSEPTEELYTG